MKKLLMIPACALVCLACLSAPAYSQCEPVDTIYGYGEVPSGSSSFGEIVGPAGDLNKDGYADILVAGVQDYFSIDATVTVFSGLTGDSLRLFYKSSSTVFGASYFGDYNGDTYPDYLINSIVYSGLTGDTLYSFGNAWRAGISAGDVNADGTHDILVERADTGYVLSGLDGDTIHYWGGYYRFGDTYAPLGDVNGDGYDDVAFGYTQDGTKRGRVFIYSGFDGSQILRLNGWQEYQEFGYNIEGAGDLNDDGYPDILVSGQSENSLTARVEVWAYSIIDTTLLFTVSGADHGVSYLDKFGYAMAGIGDVTNDGHDDFIVGAFRQASNRGNAYVFSGADGSLVFEARDRFTYNILMGEDVGGVGDTDGDGSPDFVVGCPWLEGPEDPTNDSQLRGGVLVYRCNFPPGECQVADDYDGDIWDNECDNCKWFVNFDQSDADFDGVGDQCEEARFLLEGNNRYVQFSKNNWDWAGYYPQLTFDTVLTGDTVYFHVAPLNEAIDGFTAVPYAGPLQYQFETEAVYDGIVQVKVPYLDTGLTVNQEEALQLYQKVDNVWRNISTSAPHTLYNTITGETYAPGQFAVGGCSPTPDSDGDGVGDLCDNCPFAYNPGQEDLDVNGIGDICESNDSLPSGSSQSTDLDAGGDAIHLEFSQIDTGGTVSVEVTSNGPPTASYFELYPSNPPKYYEFTSEIVFSGQVEITIQYDDAGMSPAEEAILRLWHYDPDWTDITTEHNLDSNIIRGVTTSFSPFALGLDRIPTDAPDDTQETLPYDFKVSQNYPNPFNPSTTIEYSLPQRSHVRIEVLNLLGQTVRVLTDREESAGLHRVVWDGTNEAGGSVSTGVYFYRIEANEYVASKKMLLIK